MKTVIPSPPITSDQYMADIIATDMSMIKLKLQDKEEGQGWSPSLCDEAEHEYRRFLALKRNYPDKDIVPNGIVDRFWHHTSST